jgi:hypothetical protein
MRNYTTLFDSEYSARGLVLLKTLAEQSSQEIHVDILALDDECYAMMRRLKELGPPYPSMKIWHLGQMMHPEIIKARQNRTWQEFCWTMASVFTDEVLKQTNYESITYLDADLAFFADPEIAHQEIGQKKIAIIPHRFPPEKKYLEMNGIYNVSWVTFRGDNGALCLDRWAKQCLEWCYNRAEENRMGDQKYLDEWPKIYGCCVKVIQNPGVGLAPWNLSQYELTETDGNPYVDGKRVVFYHLHEFKDNKDGSFRLTNYHLRPADISIIYDKYLRWYRQAKVHLERIKL